MQANRASKVSNKLYEICEWICRLVYINILWIASTVIGLVVFGIAPATVAMFGVLRKWTVGDTDTSVFRAFIKIYKEEFIKSNILGVIFLAFGYMIYFNYLLSQMIDGIFHRILWIGLFPTVFIYMITLFFVFPVYVHYDLKLLQYIKVAFMIAISNPLEIIIFGLTVCLLCYMFYFIPAGIPFFGVSIIAWIVMLRASGIFMRVDKK
ncbi:YesL family protein [Alkalithermobacter paradoxus]|uniref:Membrane protein YesL n=1 Tax=Alkalithermobacter paradoxus TaxID=29349 RepID=A0A1V4I7H1_9FIRM|nr:hypothetical protein CLOTH_10220 [[Clostridium] thermoalcaliphilum]